MQLILHYLAWQMLLTTFSIFPLVDVSNTPIQDTYLAPSLQISATPFLSPYPISTQTPIQKPAYVIMHGSRGKKTIALTFDADMNEYMKQRVLSGKSLYDKRIIDILTNTQTKATLFLTGMWIELYPKDTALLAKSPLFELGNHSYSHPSFDGICYGLKQIPDSQDQEEITKTQVLLKNIGGIDSKYFRFPGGCYSQKDLDIVQQNGLQTVHWDVAGVDGFNENTTSIVENVVNRVQNGSIIILHMNGAPNDPKTADALPSIIQKLKDKGFEFVKISELLRE